MAEVLTKTIANTITQGASSTTVSTKTSKINFDTNVKVVGVTITYSYSQSGYSGGNGSTLNSTLNFYDKNNVLLQTIIPKAISNTDHNVSKRDSYKVEITLKNVNHIVLTSTGKNNGGHCSHEATISYIKDFTSEMIKNKVKETILNNERFQNRVTYTVEQ